MVWSRKCDFKCLEQDKLNLVYYKKFDTKAPCESKAK